MRVIVSVIIMALITYIIRVVPITILKKEVQSNFIKSFLYYVPYAVLAALTFPSIFWATEDTMTAAIGTITAVVLALCNQGLVVVAVGAILAVYLSGMIL